MTKLYPVPAEFAARTRIGRDDYRRLYEESVRDPDGFWSRMARGSTGSSRHPSEGHQLRRAGFPHPLVRGRQAQRFGELPRSAPRDSAATRPRSSGKATIRGRPDASPIASCTTRVCRCANALHELGVQKGDRVTIYLPMIPEAAVAMLACTRIGAVHSVVFGGFSPDSLAGRIADCASTVVITADEGVRGGKKIPLKANVDQALSAPGTDTRQARARGPRTRARMSRCIGATSWYDDVVDRQSDGVRARARPTRRIRCSSCTRPARRASPRACCTRPAAISCSRR